MTATPPPLLLNRDGTVGTLTLNRPAARNGLSMELIGRITKAVAEFGADDKIAAIVITANGPAFSAGHDLKEMTAHRADPDRGRAFYTEAMAACSAMMQGIVASPKPVIAAVEGVASAAGLQLVASCDLAVASSTAKFCTPGVNIGLFCSTPMVALSRNVGRKHAMELLLLGDMMSADDALRFGLVNRVVEPGRALPDALELGWKIAEKSRSTVKIGKAAFYRQVEMSLAEAYAYASDVMVENMLARDAEEGIGAFIEKRAPEWEAGSKG